MSGPSKDQLLSCNPALLIIRAKTKSPAKHLWDIRRSVAFIATNQNWKSDNSFRSPLLSWVWGHIWSRWWWRVCEPKLSAILYNNVFLPIVWMTQLVWKINETVETVVNDIGLSQGSLYFYHVLLFILFLFLFVLLFIYIYKPTLFVYSSLTF